MSECDCCGYDGTDLPRYRDLMRDVLDNMVDKRTAELQARITLLEAVAEAAVTLTKPLDVEGYLNVQELIKQGDALNDALRAAGYLKEQQQ